MRQGRPKERRTAVAAAQRETPRELKHEPGKERFRNADVSRERGGGGGDIAVSRSPRLLPGVMYTGCCEAERLWGG